MIEPGKDVRKRPSRSDWWQLIWVADEDKSPYLVTLECPEQDS